MKKILETSENPFESPQKTTFQWSWTNRAWLVYEGENQEWKPQNPGTNPARLKIRSKDSSHIRIEQNIYFYAPGRDSTNLLMIPALNLFDAPYSMSGMWIKISFRAGSEHRVL